MKALQASYLLMLLTFGLHQSNAQSYFPKLTNFYLENEGTESVFSPETDFFRLELRKCFNKLFYGDLQTSNGGSRTNSSAFYSLKIIPRFVFETDFFDAEIKLKFNVMNDGSPFPSFPIIYNEHNSISETDEKEGKGDLTTNKGALSLQFSDKLIASGQKGISSEFLIERIRYTYHNNIFELDLIGSFANDVKIKKIQFEKNTDQIMKVIVKNNTVTFYVVSKDKNIEVFQKTVSN